MTGPLTPKEKAAEIAVIKKAVDDIAEAAKMLREMAEHLQQSASDSSEV